MKSVFKRLISSLLVCALLIGTIFVSNVNVNAAGETLLNTYGALFGNMGTCINSWQLKDANVLSEVKKQYNSITLENEMKPDAMLGWAPTLIHQDTAKSLGYYVPSYMTETYVPKINFDTVDEVLRICYENGLKMRAHTLVWHAQTPDWFFRVGYSTNYGYVSQRDMDIRMEYYIKSVMNHIYTGPYASVVYAWDVVNEYQHAADSGSGWLHIYGGVTNYPTFVKNAFQYAHDCISYFGLTDSVSLFYNDFNTYMEVDDIITMINYINSNGKICDGVGMQSHVGTTFPSVDYYTHAIIAFFNACFEVQITELDIANKGDVALANYAYQLMTNILNLKKRGANITGITYWGVSDVNSWVSENNPLLFSTIGNPKYAYYRVLDAYKDAGFVIGGSSNSGSVPAGNNIVVNGGIEDGTNNWEALYGCSLGLGYYTVHSGNLALKVTNRTGTYQGAAQTIRGLEQGATYNISAAIRYNRSENANATGNTNFIMSIIYGDGSVQNMASVSTASDTWAIMNGQYTVPANANLSNVKIYIETGSTNNAAQDLVTFFVDDISITKGGSQNNNNNNNNNNGVSAATINNGWYYIKNTNAQKYLQVAQSTGANGVNVEIGSGNGSDAQKWYVTNIGDGYITLQNALGCMLDVAYGEAEDGTNIQTFSSNGATAQHFKLANTGTAGTYGIVTRVSGDSKGVDVYEGRTADGTNVIQWAYYGSGNQTWVFEPCQLNDYANLSNGWYYIKSPYADKYLQVANNAGGNGVNVEIGTGTGAQGQKWYVTNLGNGYITLKNGQGYMLDVQYGEANDGTNIQTYSDNGATAQHFKVMRTGTLGTYGIVTRVSGDTKGLDLYNWNTHDGTNVCQWGYYGNDNQVWIFEYCG